MYFRYVVIISPSKSSPKMSSHDHWHWRFANLKWLLFNVRNEKYFSDTEWSPYSNNNILSANKPWRKVECNRAFIWNCLLILTKCVPTYMLSKVLGKLQLIVEYIGKMINAERTKGSSYTLKYRHLGQGCCIFL